MDKTLLGFSVILWFALLLPMAAQQQKPPGAGKVFKVANTIVNSFIEPQITVYHRGEGQPSFQLLMGINLQWAKKGK